MKYKVLHDNKEQDLFTRLMKVRNIEDDLERFLHPSYKEYRTDPRSIHDMEAGIDRLLYAIQHNEKIMIFGDYDVDGIMSSYVIFTFFQKFLQYKNISVRLPHRIKDGYGIKTHHIDEIAACGCSLIVTVDNGITSFEEALHAKQSGIDLVITDHHKPLDRLPEAHALINPQLNQHNWFKEVCGATVAFKVCVALAEKLITDRNIKKQLHERLLPFVSIATVADCMPLIDENRLLVKKWLQLINQKRSTIAPALRQFLAYLNIKEMDSYHIWFMIGPRLNATWRVGDPMDGLLSLLTNHPEQQLIQLQKMDDLNTERRKTQDMMIKQARELINPDRMLLVAAHESFHEWIVGIVAGRITEKHNKPSLILGVNTYDKVATWSLRGPDYFNIVEMLKTADDLLIRYGGHEQAWGMSVHLEDLDQVLERFHDYCESIIDLADLEKTTSVDTHLYEHELTNSIMDKVLSFGPYGEWNPEPLFLVENTVITHAEEVGRWERTHLKLHCKKDTIPFSVMQRGKGDTIGTIQTNQELNLIGKVKKDTFNGWFYVEGKHIIDSRL